MRFRENFQTVMSASYRFVVTGRVQGVYFRESTREQAEALGLVGWVCNLVDGRVEGVAHGSEAALEALHRWLLLGPPAARVDAVDWQRVESAPGELPTEFVVRR
ncbi:Acylphosphatase [Hydrocarboniphaga effusa AP103]|jgi:acylphosphatase|uniref:acylphosphatase n=2 Tax=Nevskiaceae TaxID=568386 RepID=I8I4Z4_9GAMM|nr:Acylphosphatase [Hydrocarboniphaga effusa AP103]